MADSASSPATLNLLQDAASGSASAAQKLLPLVYDELRRVAQRQINSERRDHTLQATALVHEAYLRLVGPRDVPWQNKAHFFAAAAEAMRRILIDHARAKGAAMRGGPDARRAAIDLTSLPNPDSDREAAGFLILDEAISRLEGVDAESAAVVRLRYFAGLTIEETAESLGISPATVKRAWVFARGWLKDAIESGRV